MSGTAHIKQEVERIGFLRSSESIFLGPGRTADVTGDMDMGYQEPNFNAEMNWDIRVMERLNTYSSRQ
jgi:hypothetical protein